VAGQALCAVDSACKASDSDACTRAGTTEPLTFAQLREQNASLPPTHLTDLLAHYNQLKDAATSGVKVRAGGAAARGGAERR